MLRYISIAILLVGFIPLSGLCQSNLQGRVIDSSEKTGISDAVVLVLQAKDSVLIDFTRTASDGIFKLAQIKSGKYILLVTKENYVDYSNQFSFDTGSNLTLGPIPLLTIAHLLQEVIVKQSQPKIRIKGDTTDYKVDSFKVGPNATLEDLLKVLPGFVVDNSGKIIANGRPVREVLVDGEPFFSDDPTLVTRNLRSDMVDKVRLYDKKTDLAAFSGITLDKKNTVIDFKLKENKKTGYFGNTSIGIGPSSYQNSEIMLNVFNGSEKFSTYGIISNTGNNGLSRQDIGKFSDNSIFSNFSEMIDPLDVWNGMYDGKGHPMLRTAGIHYNNKWLGDTFSLNSNYKFFNLDLLGQNNIDVTQVLKEKTLRTHQQQSYHNESFTNRLNGYFQLTPDSTSNIKVSFDGNLTRKTTQQTFHSETREDYNSLLNTQQRNALFHNDNNTISGDAIWMKRLKKPRRTFSISSSFAAKNIASNGFVNAISNFYHAPSIVPDTVEKIDQFKINSSRETSWGYAISFTEPISKKAILNITYGYLLYVASAHINTFNQATDLSYSDFEKKNSSNYILNSSKQKLNVQYVLTRPKYQFSVGNEITDLRFRQEDQYNLNDISRKFIYSNPLASLSYSPNGSTSFGIFYTGQTTPPLLYQLQPILLNINPLVQYRGNQNLSPSFTQSISLSFLKFRLANNQSFSSNLSFNQTDNSIGINSTVDSAGRTLNQWANVDGSYSGSFSINFSTNLPKPNLNLRVNGNTQVNRFSSITNGLLNSINNTSLSAGLTISKSKNLKYSASIGSNLSYSYANATFNYFSSKYLSILANYSLDLYLKNKFQLHTDGSYLSRQQVGGFTDVPSVFFLNSFIGKKLLKKENLLVKVSANNLLNTNSMNTRVSGAGYVSQTTYDVIERYFLLTLTWNFIKTPGK